MKRLRRATALLSLGCAALLSAQEPAVSYFGAILEGKTDVVKALLDRKEADANAADETGTTALMMAAYAGRREILELLIERKAEVNTKNKEGATALMCAAFRGHADSVKLLLGKGADFKIAQPDGWTALVAARLAGHAEAAKILEEAGAKVDAEFLVKLARDLAVKTLNEARQIDAAKDEWATKKKPEGDAKLSWKDLTPYMKPGSRLVDCGGNDRLGHAFAIGTVLGAVRVDSRTRGALKEATGGDGFWGPYS